jgi:addiction module RelE/StbE family toxin
MKIRWTRRAVTSLTNIHEHIAADDLNAANQLRDRVVAFVETKLAPHPSIGRPGRVEGTRESIIHPSYILVYRTSAEAVEILTIRHVAQKWPKQF